jgi:hypothetical protein
LKFITEVKLEDKGEPVLKLVGDVHPVSFGTAKPDSGTMRILHHAQVIAITGKSYRVKEAPLVTQENKKNRKAHEPSTAGGAS